MPELIRRNYSAETCAQLIQQGLHPVLARIYAARGIAARGEIETELAQLIPPQQLTHAERAAVLLADAIAAQQKLMIIADYDCDGATACAIAIRALRMFGAQVDYLVPDRFVLGYGLTPEIVRLAAQSHPDLIITVDNGIASLDGVAEANRLGIRVLITDHHLPGATLPDAACIVNPNQPDCSFTSKYLAGVGVMFYVLLALRVELRARGAFVTQAEPNLAQLLDLVALGTVADVVRLDSNNRILVEQGLRRIRAGRACAGIQALCRIAGVEMDRISTLDLSFSLAPRLNAAGRLTDMRLGIECLISDNLQHTLGIAEQLNALNRERRSIEAVMQQQALTILESMVVQPAYTICLFDPDWHQGVIGILAARVKEKYGRPTIVFARGEAGEIKGSGRSIAALHLRDALDLIAKREPDLLLKFGGHAAAAGLTLRESELPRFISMFEQTVAALLTPADLNALIETDGALDEQFITLEVADLLNRQIWGQGFPPPLFCDTFTVETQRVVADKHLKLKLRKNGKFLNAIRFNHTAAIEQQCQLTYRLESDEFNGLRSVQLIIEHC